MATPTVQYNTKTGAKLKAGESTMVNGKSQVAGSAYTGANAYGSNSKVVNYSNKTGQMLNPGETTTYGGQSVKQGQELPTLTPNAPIDTKQPSPTNIPEPTTPGTPIDTMQPNVPFAEALKNLGAGATTEQKGSLAQKYQTGLAQTAGTPPPPTMGGAGPTIKSTLPPQPQDTSNIDTALAEDKGYQQLIKDTQDYNHVVNQQKSLVDTYNEYIKKAGIPAINTELLNTQRIINGTEDDIRSEVQAVSGFATDSQVLALASARNKSLIANYNNLLDTKKMAMENIQTMIGLAKQDQETAMNNVMQKMNIDAKLMDYRDKFVNNAKEGYANVIKAIGYDGLLQSLQSTGDPSTISTFEKTMGMPPGSLQIASQQAITARANQTKMDKLDLENKSLTNQKLRQDLNPIGNGSVTLDPKKQQAINTILGSGKFTKDQANAIKGAISSGEDPFTVIKNQAKALMTGANQTKIESYETAQGALNNVEKSLADFYASGGSTNIFRGNYEKTLNKLGEVKNPKLVELATEIQQNLQIYRNAVSGTAYSVQEGADIASIFPGITKTEGLNKAIINGRRQAFVDGIDSAYRATLGSTYDQFKQAENTIPAQDFSKGTISGLNFNIPGVGSFTFPSQKSLEEFKKDHNL